MEAKNVLTSSLGVQRSQLKGIRVETGALVSFRDAPAFEMVMRLNQRYKGKLVTAILKRNDDDNAVKKEEEREVCSVIGGLNNSKDNRFVFVPEAYEIFLENEMQKWLDPFHGRSETGTQKRTRDGWNSFRSDDEDSVDDVGNNGGDYIDSSSSD